MYLNGAQIGTQGACKAVTTSPENAACGNIVYPSAIDDVVPPGPTG